MNDEKPHDAAMPAIIAAKSLLTGSEAAWLLGCAETDLAALERQGLPHVQIGTNQLVHQYRRDDLEAWARRQAMASDEARTRAATPKPTAPKASTPTRSHAAPKVAPQPQAPKAPTMANRNTYTTNRHRPQPSPKLPQLSAREQRLALEHLRREIRTLEAKLGGAEPLAGRTSALPPEQKRELDMKFGLLSGTKIVNTPHKLILGAPAYQPQAASKRSSEEIAEEAGRVFEETFNREKDRKPREIPKPTGDLPTFLGGKSKATHDRAALARKMGLEPDATAPTANPYRLTLSGGKAR